MFERRFKVGDEVVDKLICKPAIIVEVDSSELSVLPYLLDNGYWASDSELTLVTEDNKEFPIVQKYHIDGLVFDTLREAQDHLLLIKLHAELNQVDMNKMSFAEYDIFCETMKMMVGRREFFAKLFAL